MTLHPTTPKSLRPLPRTLQPAPRRNLTLRKPNTTEAAPLVPSSVVGHLILIDVPDSNCPDGGYTCVVNTRTLCVRCACCGAISDQETTSPCEHVAPALDAAFAWSDDRYIEDLEGQMFDDAAETTMWERLRMDVACGGCH